MSAFPDLIHRPDPQRLKGLVIKLPAIVVPHGTILPDHKIKVGLLSNFLVINAVTDIRRLTAPERKLVQAAEAGAEADLRALGDGQPGVIRAEVLRDLCTGAIAGWKVKGSIRMKGGQVRGRLDLSGTRLAHPLRFAACVFEESIDLRHARAEQLVEWDGGSTGGILADRFEGGADFAIKNAVVTGVVSLQRASLQGDLRLTGSCLRGPSSLALDGANLRVSGSVFLDDGFHATGEVRLGSASIEGKLCCTGGFFDNPNGRALDAERIAAEDVYLDRGFRAHGDVRFNDAQVTGQFNATHGEFRNERCGANQYALDCDGLRCGADVFLNDGFRATGTVSLRGADIKDELNCTAGSFTKTGDGYALFADGMTTPGTVFLGQEFRADGEVRFVGATVGQQLVCTGGVFDNPHGVALDLSRLIVHGDVFLNHAFRVTGELRLRNAVITHNLDFTDAELLGSEGIDALGMEVGGCLIWIMNQPAEGLVDLSFAHVGWLDDTSRSWATNGYVLTDFTYRPARGNRKTVQEWIFWLYYSKHYAAGSYEQLVQAYRLKGEERSAKAIAIAGQRHLRLKGGLSRTSRMWNMFLEATAGYGYRLYRIPIALLIYVLIGGVIYYFAMRANLIFSASPPHRSALRCLNEHRCFNSFMYTLDMLVPVLNVGQAADWYPNVNNPWDSSWLFTQ